MNVYVYRAALLCESCGIVTRKRLDPYVEDGFDADAEDTYDSDDYPKGPYADGGGEADSPAHCEECGAFLENPLTSDGARYVADVGASERCEERRGIFTIEWGEFYDVKASPGCVRHPVRLPCPVCNATNESS